MLSKLKKNNRSRQPLWSEQDKQNIRWFWDLYLKQKTPWLLLVLGMLLLQGLVYQQFLSLTEDGLRVIFDSGDTQDLIVVCLMVFLIFSVRGFLSFIIPRLSVWVASDAVLKMRQDLINRLLSLDLAYFERTGPGEIILRIVSQAQELSIFVGQTTINAVRDAVAVIVISGYLIYKSPLLFTVAIIILPTMVVIMHQVSHRIKSIQASAENAMGAYMGGIEEMANGMRTVKISGQENQERRRLFEATEGIKELSIKLQASQALVLPATDIMAAIVYVLVIGGGGYMALSGSYDMDGAAIITFLIGLALVIEPARKFIQFIVRLQANLVLLEGVASLYREAPTIVDMPDASEDFDPNGDITLRDVTFSYHPDQPLFENLNMEFKGGKVSAIVGATGSGKTTVLSLLSRLYPLNEGEICIGGRPIDQLKIASVRRAFSVVAQDIVIFNSSIWENIRYVRPEATDEEIWAAADAAELADLIRRRGDAPLGPKGSQLSGGQKQRIAIARSFLRSAPILLLDEATSALDQRTEDKVKKALKRLSKHKTTLIVAHRLSAVASADWIYVLDMGRIVEQGTHDDLLKRSGLYAGMYKAQKQSYG